MSDPNISGGVNIYLRFSQGLERFSRLPKPLARAFCIVEACWQAVWLGLLDTDRLNQITRAHYMGRSGFEDEKFNIHQGLWPWEEDSIQNHFRGKRRVLVAGAGGGREVIALVRRGYEVTAFDFSSYLIAACRRNLEKAGCIARVLEAPPDGVPDGLDVYDALLIGRGFYHHIPCQARRVAFLRDCHAHLKFGAPIILSDFFTRSPNSRFYLRTQSIANFLRWLQNSAERVELGDWLTDCMQHAFTREEIEQELLASGFHVEIFAISPFSEKSHLAHVLGRTS